MPLSPPPRDPSGAVLPHDHEEILPADGVIRRVPKEWIVEDPKVPGGKRLSTEVFKPSSAEQGGGLSIDLEREIIEAGVDVMMHVTSPRWIGSVKLSAADLREKNMQVGFSPVDKTEDEPANPFHGEAWGHVSKGQMKSLLRVSQWLVEIPGCLISAPL